MRLRVCVPVVAATLATVPPVLPAQQAAPLILTLNPSQTSIRWTLNTTLHTVHGTFRLKTGELHIDPASGEASGMIVVDASSGESGDSARDRRMHADILESGSFPEISYRPSHVSGKIDLANGGDVTVDGIFRIHGTDHPLQLNVHLQADGSAAKLSTRFTIPYVVWGMKDPSKAFLHVDKQVALDVDSTLTNNSSSSPSHAILHPGEVHTAQ